MEYRQKISEVEKENVRADRMESLSNFIKMKAFDEKQKIPNTIIDYYVDKIIYDKGMFTWILNPRLGNHFSSIEIDMSNIKKNQNAKIMYEVDCNSGSY